MPKALIFGISGQDGSYLAELLIREGYEVFGMIRRHSYAESQDIRLQNVPNGVDLTYGDLTDPYTVHKLVREVQADEIYNLAAQSHVRVSFDIPHFTLQVNGLAVLNILEAIKDTSPKSRFYQASSSEMFGNNRESDGFQRESTPMDPVSPYGCAKLLSYKLVRHYRRAYRLHLCNGILFNHGSPRRGINFVEQKIARSAVELGLGLKTIFEFGNLGASRDWGHSRDYVRAMTLIVRYPEPRDFVIATGDGTPLWDLWKYCLEKLTKVPVHQVAEVDRYRRPEELVALRGDATKARVLLGWKPTISVWQLMDELFDFWMRYYTEGGDAASKQFQNEGTHDRKN